MKPEAFEAVLSGLTPEGLAFMLEAAYTLKVARDAGDRRPGEVILGPLLAQAGIELPSKRDEARDRRAT